MDGEWEPKKIPNPECEGFSTICSIYFKNYL
jgi:hypothetical protein